MRFYLLPIVIATNSAVAADRGTLPDGFVYLNEFIPGLVVELRYATEDNFVGRPVDGYGQHARAGVHAVPWLHEVPPFGCQCARGAQAKDPLSGP